MAKRQKNWARRAKTALFALLGGKCVKCGTTENLTFDCIVPQGDRHHKTDTSARICFYRRQHYEHQNVQILCRFHNIEKSDNQPF